MESLPKHLIPLETFCTVCPGNIPLSDPIIITQKAKIVTFTGVLEDVTTYCKRCGLCGHFYRYQEWAEGLHNFDDHTILTLHLCLFLRQSVQNHTAVGRAFDILEQTNKKKYPNHDSLLHGYLHFEALTAHDYNFSCVHCGVHPPVVIMDLHKKGVFSMPVSDIEDPPPQFEGHVNIEEFWQSVDQEIICRGFLQSNHGNPFKVSPSYSNWAPWIGPLTRASNSVLNTEYAKLTTKKSVAEYAEMNITEERLSSELMNLKVDALRKLVKECGVDSKGSKMDLLLRLREEMKTRSTYDKVFQKVWGASGGWAVIMCPCGIVNSVKFNIRAESPRDYADMLLSFQHFPNIVIYDFARGLVTHTNLREPQRLPFSPHEGRVAAATPENIESAKRGELKINLPWLQLKKDPPDLNGHPATGSAEHYALYDTFHQYNTRDEKDALRVIGLVPELCGWINSQTAEQLFSGMRKNNYFMNSLSPASHIFLMRNILHHHNERVNQQALEEFKQVSHGDITLDTHGKAILVHADVPTDVDTPAHCGEQCEALTMKSNLRPCRASWTLGLQHPLQEKLVNYVLDEHRPMNEIIIKDGQTCLTRENFVTLGLRKEMDSVVGNACFRIIKEIILHQGKDVYVVDLHIPPTWLLPSSCDPLLCLPLDSQKKDALIFPLWTPGHYLLCVIKPLKREILFLDSRYSDRGQGFTHGPYRNILRSVAEHIVSGPLPELTGLDVKGLPRQHYGIDCGIFMIMYSWYVVMDAPFDFTVHDMPCLRRWWCTVLVENLEIEGHGRRFAHFTKQGIEMARGSLHPIFRIPRKRKYEEPVLSNPCKVKKPCEVESSPKGMGILQLPEEILHRIFILVVLHDGDPAIHTLALTCTHFWRVVREESFLKEAHFCWLDSVVNWDAFSEEHRRTYRTSYRISRCIHCSSLYKDCEGYRGSGQRGKLQGFYSDNEFAGYCSADCFYEAGCTL